VYVYFGVLLDGEFQEVVFMGYSSWGAFDGCFYEIQVWFWNCKLMIMLTYD
jgi:hypothetical protein